MDGIFHICNHQNKSTVGGGEGEDGEADAVLSGIDQLQDAPHGVFIGGEPDLDGGVSDLVNTLVVDLDLVVPKHPAVHLLKLGRCALPAVLLLDY